MDEKEIIHLNWCHGVIFVALMGNIIINIILCFQAEDFKPLILAGNTFIIPCMAEMLKFLCCDSHKMDYNKVETVVKVLLVTSFVCMIINFVGTLFEQNVFFTVVSAIGMMIYAAKEGLFFLYFFRCINQNRISNVTKREG